jgi:hypothetical protein
MEAQARQNASRIAGSINASRNGQAPTWSFQGQMASSGNRVTWGQVNSEARRAINPQQCIWINNQMNITGTVFGAAHPITPTCSPTAEPTG